MASVVGEREIDLSKLSIEQLNQLKTQLSEELEEITQHYASLRNAQSRLNSCRTTVSELAPTPEGTEILVPLTQSLYVPGNTSEADKLLMQKEQSLRMVSGYFQKKLMVMSHMSEARQAQLAASQGQK
ncbi:Hypothetical protein NocV09_02100230 [Nannochloropsis oceanica]